MNDIDKRTYLFIPSSHLIAFLDYASTITYLY